MTETLDRTSLFIAKFSNGFVKTVSDGRRSYTHAWHARGLHRLSNQPWEYSGYSTSENQAARNMERMTRFAQPDRITFAEVVQVTRN